MAIDAKETALAAANGYATVHQDLVTLRATVDSLRAALGDLKREILFAIAHAGES